MTDWFRSWHGAPTDPKWLGIAKRAGVAPGITVAVAWALMDRASQASERGDITGYDADGLACFFGCDPEQVDAIVAAMTDKGMLSDGRFVAWERRQPKREDDSGQRVKEHRARNAVKRTVTQCNAEKRDITLDSDSEKKDIKFKGRENLNGVAPQAPVADLIAAASRKGGDKSNYLWLKQSDTRVPQMREWWRSNYGTDPPLTYRNGRPGYHVPWAAVNGH